MNAGFGWVCVEAPSDGDMARHFFGGDGVCFLNDGFMSCFYTVDRIAGIVSIYPQDSHLPGVVATRKT